jgi:hypothetical protein
VKVTCLRPSRTRARDRRFIPCIIDESS